MNMRIREENGGKVWIKKKQRREEEKREGRMEGRDGAVDIKHNMIEPGCLTRA